jgi:TIR domain
MLQVFLSYSKKDHVFAELAQLKLVAAGIEVWRDLGQLRPGSDWRKGIEEGIAQCDAVVVALSPHSSESSYVTFEWAYALGKGKVVVPLKLADCSIHPKLETIQYLDFSIPGSLPWEALVAEIKDIEVDANAGGATSSQEQSRSVPPPDDTHAKAILAYLDQRGYQMASFDRLRRRIDASLTDEQFNEIILRNPGVFRHALLKEGKRGLAKLGP